MQKAIIHLDMDARLLRLVERLGPLGYGVIILADHGQPFKGVRWANSSQNYGQAKTRVYCQGCSEDS